MTITASTSAQARKVTSPLVAGAASGGGGVVGGSRWYGAVIGVLRLPLLLLMFALLAGCASPTHFEHWGGHATPVHLVARGDTLYSIAVENDLDWRDLARWNGIRDPHQLRVGQLLRLVPPRGGAYRHTASAAKPAPRKHATRTRHSTASRSKTTHKSKSTHRPHEAHQSSPKHWRWPVRGKILSRYVPSDPTHKGVVLAGKMGEKVHASAAGQVVYAGNGLPGYGNLVIIKHSEKMLTAYAYNRRLLVHQDQRVKAGQAIATMGHPPGRAYVNKPSLLFQIRRNGKPVDPLHYLPRR